MSPKESIKNDRVIETIKGGVEKLGVRGLARAVGISPAIVTRYMQGKVGEPSQATLEKLANYFKLPVPWLRGDFDDQNMSYKTALSYKKVMDSSGKSGWVGESGLEKEILKINNEHIESLINICTTVTGDELLAEFYKMQKNIEDDIKKLMAKSGHPPK